MVLVALPYAGNASTHGYAYLCCRLPEPQTSLLASPASTHQPVPCVCIPLCTVRQVHSCWPSCVHTSGQYMSIPLASMSYTPIPRRTECSHMQARCAPWEASHAALVCSSTRSHPYMSHGLRTQTTPSHFTLDIRLLINRLCSNFSLVVVVCTRVIAVIQSSGMFLSPSCSALQSSDFVSTFPTGGSCTLFGSSHCLVAKDAVDASLYDMGFFDLAPIGEGHCTALHSCTS